MKNVETESTYRVSKKKLKRLTFGPRRDYWKKLWALPVSDTVHQSRIELAICTFLLLRGFDRRDITIMLARWWRRRKLAPAWSRVFRYTFPRAEEFTKPYREQHREKQRMKKREESRARRERIRLERGPRNTIGNRVLIQLAAGPSTMAELAETLQIAKETMKVVLWRLKRAGVVSVEANVYGVAS